MKKTGFTLIELLAVIVILAIIALIAVPIVINIINDVKVSSEKESIKLYMDHAKKMIAKEQMKDSTFNPSECEIKPEGILECKNETKTYSPIKIEMKGQIPESGTIKFSKGMVIEGENLELNGLYYQVKDDKVSDGTTKKIVDVTREKHATLLSDVGVAGLSIGDKYEYEVYPGKKHIFYVLSIEDNAVNLIMDRNICENGSVEYTLINNYCNYAWHAGENNTNYGPDTAMEKLYNATKNWSNVPDMIMDYQDEENPEDSSFGYKDIITNLTTKITTITGKNGASTTPIGTAELPLKARLPKLEEFLSEEVECQGDVDGTCSVWLVGNLMYDIEEFNDYCSDCISKYLINSENGITYIYGYWLLNSYPENDSVFLVGFSGNIGSDITSSSLYGIRPVITVLKSDLE